MRYTEATIINQREVGGTNMKRRLWKKVMAAGIAAIISTGMFTSTVAAGEQTTIELWYHISPDQATL